MSDLIDRQAAIDALTDQRLVDNMDSVNDTMFHKTKRAAQRILASMPSAQPERKRGRWLPDNNNYITPKFVCSACRMSQNVETVMYYPLWAFCPRCGAKMMRGEQDDEELGHRDSR